MVENKSIALICCHRSILTHEVLLRLSKCFNAKEFNLNIYVDFPKNEDFLNDHEELLAFLSSTELVDKFKSFKLVLHKKNMGVWNAKLYALLDSFRDADTVLIIEDDVFLEADALIFIEKLLPWVARRDELTSISLYSINLLHGGKKVERNALDILDKNPSLLGEWGCRTWPFPWGICFYRKHFQALMRLGWNGNDQSMGMLFKKHNGLDIFPIISRSHHIASTNQLCSKFEGNQTEHLEFSSVLFSEDLHFNIGLSAEQAINLADERYLDLRYPDNLAVNCIKIFYDHPDLSEVINKFKADNISLEVISNFLDVPFNDFKNNGSLYEVIERVETSIIVLLIQNGDLMSFVENCLKNKGVLVLKDLNIDVIKDAILNLR